MPTHLSTDKGLSWNPATCLWRPTLLSMMKSILDHLSPSHPTFLSVTSAGWAPSTGATAPAIPPQPRSCAIAMKNIERMQYLLLHKPLKTRCSSGRIFKKMLLNNHYKNLQNPKPHPWPNPGLWLHTCRVSALHLCFSWRRDAPGKGQSKGTGVLYTCSQCTYM